MTDPDTPTHSRDSEWRILQRCLAILRRIMQGDATTEALRNIVRSYADPAEEIQDSAIAKRLETDLYRLRKTFQNEITYGTASKTYQLARIDPPLIDLPPDAVQALAFLQSAFQDDTPMKAEIHSLIQLLLMAIPEERRNELEKYRNLLEIDLRKRDRDVISDHVFEGLDRACRQHLEIEFSYGATSREDGQAVLHHVEPLRYFFDSTRKHYYLEAFCLETTSQQYPRRPDNTFRTYRLGRIGEIRVLPNRFVPGLRRIPEMELIYILNSEVARGGVTGHFPGQVVTLREDGSAEVRANVRDLFFSLRTLLHYGGACQVIGGPEAVKEMRALVSALAERYSDGD